MSGRRKIAAAFCSTAREIWPLFSMDANFSAADARAPSFSPSFGAASGSVNPAVSRAQASILGLICSTCDI
jgi:hypothetical protein